jgi:hypothetical protein
MSKQPPFINRYGGSSDDSLNSLALDYAPIVKPNPAIVPRFIVPQNGQPVLQFNSPVTSTFTLPPVFWYNSSSCLMARLRMNIANNNATPFLFCSQVPLYSVTASLASGAILVPLITDLNVLSRFLVPHNTSLTEYLNFSRWESLIGNEDEAGTVAYVNHANPFPCSGQSPAALMIPSGEMGISGGEISNLYITALGVQRVSVYSGCTTPQLVYTGCISTGNMNRATVVDLYIPFSMFHGTWLSTRQLQYFGQTVNLTVQWLPQSDMGFNSGTTNNSFTFENSAAFNNDTAPAISNVKIMLAVESNMNVTNALLAQWQTSGIKQYLPRLSFDKRPVAANQSGTFTHNTSVSLPQNGFAIQRVYCFLANEGVGSQRHNLSNSYTGDGNVNPEAYARWKTILYTLDSQSESDTALSPGEAYALIKARSAPQNWMCTSFTMWNNLCPGYMVDYTGSAIAQLSNRSVTGLQTVSTMRNLAVTYTLNALDVPQSSYIVVQSLSKLVCSAQGVRILEV